MRVRLRIRGPAMRRCTMRFVPPTPACCSSAMRRRSSSRCRRPAAGVRGAPVATIEGREIVMRDALVLPGLERPLRFAAGVDLPAIVELTGRCHDIPALISNYQSRVGPIPVAQLLTGVSLLVAQRALVNDIGAGAVRPGTGARSAGSSS